MQGNRDKQGEESLRNMLRMKQERGKKRLLSNRGLWKQV